jgi:hypothetical protein
MADEEFEVDDSGPTFELGGNTYDSWEEAQKALKDWERANQAKAQDAAEVKRENSTLRDELERLRQESEEARNWSPPQSNGSQIPNPAEDPEAWFEYRLRERLGTPMQNMGAMLRQLQSEVQSLRAAGAGVNVEEVRRRIQRDYADEPATMHAMLASPKAMKQVQQAMEAELHQEDLSELVAKKKAAKANNTTQSGAGEGGRSVPHIPTAEEYMAMTPEQQDAFEKKLDKDPKLAAAFLGTVA